MLKQIALFFIKLYLFWMAFFALNRLVFVLYHYDKMDHLPVSEIFHSFYHAFSLDSSAACYLMGLSIFFMILQLLFTSKLFKTISKVYVALIIIIVGFITTVDLALYEEWATKLHYKALIYLEHPQEVIASAASSPLLLLILIFVLQSFIGIFCYLKFFHVNMAPRKSKNKVLLIGKTALGILSFLFLIIVGVRGGLQEIPINQSAAYFSKDNIMNHTAVNSPWSLLHSISENWENLDNNPYEFYELTDASQIVQDAHQYPTDTITEILTTTRPNIVLMIIEGWTADIISPLGGEKNITPYFTKLAAEGVLFTNFYAAGMRSDKGIVAIFSSFPAQPATSITTQPNKFEKLHSINQQLKELGYQNYFYFGGELNYGNIKSYLIFNQFDKIIETSNFPSDFPRASLGVHDEFVFDLMLKDLNQATTPFFSTIFTLSSHEPFDIPDQWQNRFKKEEGEEEKEREAYEYLSAVHYTDNCIGKFIEKAREQAWYDNTLFIIVSDHSHHWPVNRQIFLPERHKIPMLFFGGAVKEKFRGLLIDKVGGQVDIGATLLSQLQLPHHNFTWSKDLLNPSCPDIGFYTFIEGFGYIRGTNSFSYENRFKKIMHRRFEDGIDEEEIIKEGNSYMQVLFQEYLDK